MSDYKVCKMDPLAQIEAKRVYVRVYEESLKEGSVPRDRLDDHLVQKGIIDKAHKQKIDEINKEIEELLEPLRSGGIKLSEMETRARKAATLRLDLYELVTHKFNYDYMTAENKAEDARFTYTIFHSFRNADGTRVWQKYEDFLNCQDSELIEKAVTMVNESNQDDKNFDLVDVFKKTPENEFLLKYKFVNDKLENTKEEEPIKFLDDEGKEIVDV